MQANCQKRHRLSKTFIVVFLGLKTSLTPQERMLSSSNDARLLKDRDGI
jgi:hypothetical protein